MPKRHGYEWRILTKTDRGGSIALASPECRTRDEAQPTTPPNTYFDELVIDDWQHLERMDENAWWLRVGEKRIWIRFDKSGKTHVSIEEV